MIRELSHRPLIIGHRGASAVAPENTLAAFIQAANDQADGIEFDVKLTRDHQIIIMHDATVDRTTNGKGKVAQFKLADIRELDAGSHFSQEFKDEKVPLLTEVLESIPGDMIVNIELTNYTTPLDGLAEKTAHLIKRLNFQDRVIFSSFNPFNLWRTRRILPSAEVAVLALPGSAGAINRSWLGRLFAPQFINPYYSDINQSSIEKQHGMNRKVIAWTVNDVEEMIRLFTLGVDGIITDNPGQVRTVLGVE